VAVKPRVLEQVLDAFRERDLDECIRLVRTLVEAAPQATAPRQLLAALFASTGNGRQALAHYRRLLPQAAARGEVIRAIAFQKQIDVYSPADSLAPGRWGALQKQLRERGLPFLSEAPGSHGKPWTEAQLLALPRAWFERIAAETRFEILGLEQCSIDVEAGTVWEVLAGRMRWSFALPDGRASAEALAAEGDAVHVDPGLARSARVTLVPELPVEALRFEADLARDLKLALTAGLHVTPATVPGLTEESRALLPTRPRRKEDLDDRPLPPRSEPGAEPLRLPVPIGPTGDGGSESRDTGDWVEFGVLSLDHPRDEHLDRAAAPVGDGNDAAGADFDPGSRDDDRIDRTPPAKEADAAVGAGHGAEMEADSVPPPAADVPISAAADAPPPPSPWIPGHERIEEPSETDIEPEVVEAHPGDGGRIEVPDDDTADSLAGPPPVPVDAASELIHPPSRSPFPPSSPDPEVQVERRRHPRVTVSLTSRLALLRLGGTRVQPVEGRLGDLSTSGFSIRFDKPTLGASSGALADAVVAVDLDIPGPQGALRVAAQVRWIEEDEAGDEVRVGIEFVLLTEPDRRRIAGTLARAALAAREQERKAA